MPDSIRDQIIQALVFRLSDAIGIDCQRVPRVQRDHEGDILGVVDGEDVPESIEYGAIRKLMQVTVQHIKEYDPATENESTVANAMLADLEAAVTGTDTTLYGLCLGMRYSGGMPAYDASTPSEYAAVVAAFEVTYQTDIGDPYTDSNPH